MAALDMFRLDGQTVAQQPLPPPRVDRYDRIVADVDREMVRLTAAALDEMAALAWELGEIDVERVVRFGRLATDLRIEAHAWRAVRYAFTASVSALLSPALSYNDHKTALRNLYAKNRPMPA